MRGVQGCTPVNAQGVSGLLEFLLTGFLFIPFLTFSIAILLLTAPGGFSVVLRSLAGAICFTAPALPASAILTFFLITLLILCSLFHDKLLNLMTFLKIVALGPMDLAVRPIAFPGPFGSHSLPAVSARDNFLAGGFSISLFAGARCARSLNCHHCLVLALFVALLALPLTGGYVIVV